MLLSDNATLRALAWMTACGFLFGILNMMQKLLKDRKITLDLTDAAKRWLGRVGYDPVYGARPLKRAVQRYLQDPLAEKLLGGEIPDGSTVKIDEGDGELKIAVG